MSEMRVETLFEENQRLKREVESLTQQLTDGGKLVYAEYKRQQDEIEHLKKRLDDATDILRQWTGLPDKSDWDVMKRTKQFLANNK